MSSIELIESEKARELQTKIEEYMVLTEPIFKAITNLRAMTIPKMVFVIGTGELKIEYPPEYLNAQKKFEQIISEIHNVVFGDKVQP